jgi:hypothetical protein
MTVITPGNGATLLSNTLEGQMLEIATFLKLAEQSPAKNPNSRNFIGITCNFSTLIANITFSLPAAPGINNVGQLLTTATPYLQTTGFNPGSGGTFTSETPEAYLLELVTALQIKEADGVKNPTQANNVSATYDSDELIFDGTASLPLEILIQLDGSIKILADEYLLD